MLKNIAPIASLFVLPLLPLHAAYKYAEYVQSEAQKNLWRDLCLDGQKSSKAIAKYLKDHQGNITYTYPFLPPGVSPDQTLATKAEYQLTLDRENPILLPQSILGHFILPIKRDKTNLDRVQAILASIEKESTERKTSNSGLLVERLYKDFAAKLLQADLARPVPSAKQLKTIHSTLKEWRPSIRPYIKEIIEADVALRKPENIKSLTQVNADIGEVTKHQQKAIKEREDLCYPFQPEDAPNLLNQLEELKALAEQVELYDKLCKATNEAEKTLAIKKAKTSGQIRMSGEDIDTAKGLPEADLTNRLKEIRARQAAIQNNFEYMHTSVEKLEELRTAAMKAHRLSSQLHGLRAKKENIEAALAPPTDEMLDKATEQYITFFSALAHALPHLETAFWLPKLPKEIMVLTKGEKTAKRFYTLNLESNLLVQLVASEQISPGNPTISQEKALKDFKIKYPVGMFKLLCSLGGYPKEAVNVLEQKKTELEKVADWDAQIKIIADALYENNLLGLPVLPQLPDTQSKAPLTTLKKALCLACGIALSVTGLHLYQKAKLKKRTLRREKSRLKVRHRRQLVVL